MQVNIVYQKKLETNQNVIIRYPGKSDAKVMCDYINSLSKEKTYITYQGETITLKDEQEYLKDQLKRIKNSLNFPLT